MPIQTLILIYLTIYLLILQVPLTRKQPAQTTTQRENNCGLFPNKLSTSQSLTPRNSLKASNKTLLLSHPSQRQDRKGISLVATNKKCPNQKMGKFSSQFLLALPINLYQQLPNFFYHQPTCNNWNRCPTQTK